MSRILEFAHIGYDSQVIKPDLGEYENIPAVQAWLNKDSKDRFPLPRVSKTLNFTLDGFGTGKISPEDESKRNFCIGMLNELAQEGRKSPFFKLLELYKRDALAIVLQGEKARENLTNGNTDSEVLEEMVTFQVIGFFLNRVNNPPNKKGPAISTYPSKN